MKRGAKTTMDRVRRAIEAAPLRRSAVITAFHHFRESGELPESQRLADAVARTALNGGRPLKDAKSMSELERILSTPSPSLRVISREEANSPPPSPVRDVLLHQAVFETGAVRHAARAAIRWLVDGGEDVVDPQFAASYGLPKHGSAGLHVLGWPRLLVKPPFEVEARRLIAKYDALFDTIDYENEDWFEPIADATLQFWNTNELSGPGVVRDAVLVLEGLDLLMAHRRGVNVAKQVAALDRVLTTQGDERERAVAKFARVHRRHATRSRFKRRVPQ